VIISIPSHVTISRLIQRMKGKSSYRLLAAFFYLRKRFRGCHVWARGDFYRGSGNITHEVLKAYLVQQAHNSDDGFWIEGGGIPVRVAPIRGSLVKGASPAT
jgi:putative transposase